MRIETIDPVIRYTLAAMYTLVLFLALVAVSPFIAVYELAQIMGGDR